MSGLELQEVLLWHEEFGGPQVAEKFDWAGSILWTASVNLLVGVRKKSVHDFVAKGEVDSGLRASWVESKEEAAIGLRDKKGIPVHVHLGRFDLDTQAAGQKSRIVRRPGHSQLFPEIEGLLATSADNLFGR